MGAIIADVAFSYVDDRTKFILSAIFGLVGVAVTSVFLPDSTGGCDIRSTCCMVHDL